MRRECSLLESLKEDALEASYRDRVDGRLTARRRDGLGNLQRELMVHREALGLFLHDVLARHYALPPKRRRSKASAGS